MSTRAGCIAVGEGRRKGEVDVGGMPAMLWGPRRCHRETECKGVIVVQFGDSQPSLKT